MPIMIFGKAAYPIRSDIGKCPFLADFLNEFLYMFVPRQIFYKVYLYSGYYWCQSTHFTIILSLLCIRGANINMIFRNIINYDFAIVITYTDDI